MNAPQITAMLFDTAWASCVLTLTSGQQIRVTHPDYLLMPKHRAWVMYVPDEQILQLIPVEHIASIQIRRRLKAA